MNIRPKIETHFSACPHDCPSTCALEVEKLDDFTIGRVRGAETTPIRTVWSAPRSGRYAERIHHPDRLKHSHCAGRRKGLDRV